MVMNKMKIFLNLQYHQQVEEILCFKKKMKELPRKIEF